MSGLHYPMVNDTQGHFMASTAKNLALTYTHKNTYYKICKEAVTRLLSSRYQDVFALLVPSCCDKSETSCHHFVTRLMMVTDLLQVFPTCSKLVNNWEQALRTYLVDKLGDFYQFMQLFDIRFDICHSPFKLRYML